MIPLPAGMTRCPRNCAADAGWDYSDDDVRWCKHGADEAAAEAAERRDRIIADRRRRATGATQ